MLVGFSPQTRVILRAIYHISIRSLLSASKILSLHFLLSAELRWRNVAPGWGLWLEEPSLKGGTVLHLGQRGTCWRDCCSTEEKEWLHYFLPLKGNDYDPLPVIFRTTFWKAIFRIGTEWTMYCSIRIFCVWIFLDKNPQLNKQHNILLITSGEHFITWP